LGSSAKEKGNECEAAGVARIAVMTIIAAAPGAFLARQLQKQCRQQAGQGQS